ncbi:MAG: hypothetical protein ACLFWL_11850 [Candidatus Brocadiia bacterium]
MSDTRKTDERLRGWLDSNQVQRERLCAHLLPLLGPYSHVECRRPKGGPDGGRDMEAKYKEDYCVWCAVGFRNSARDDKEDKRWVENKFTDDLRRALEEDETLQGFVFFTNIDLTPGETDALKEFGKKEGVGHIDIFARERLRLALDSVEGWGYRLRFLDIAMSKEEQIAFTDRFGARLESLLEDQKTELREQQNEINEKLRRIEFFHDCSKPARGVRFGIFLKGAKTPEDLGHFRILLEAMKFSKEGPHSTIWFGARDAYSTWHSGDSETRLFGVKTLVWSENPDEDIQETIIGASAPAGQVIASSAHLYGTGPVQELGDFDGLCIRVWVTKPLVEHIRYLGFTVNKYLLIGVPEEHIATREQILGRVHANVGEVDWMEDLSPAESEVEWIELCIKGPDANVPMDAEHPPGAYERTVPWDIHFDDYAPVKLSAKQNTTVMEADS